MISLHSETREITFTCDECQREVPFINGMQVYALNNHAYLIEPDGKVSDFKSESKKFCTENCVRIAFEKAHN